MIGILFHSAPILRMSCSPDMRVNHAARTEEEQRFEKRVRHQMEDSRGERAHAQRKEHVPKLADRRVGQNALDIVLHQRHRRRENCGARADGRDHVHRVRRELENRVQPRDHVHARGHHRRRVDQRADRRGAFHRVRQPDVQRNLRGFSGRADKQQQRNGRHHRGADLGNVRRQSRQDRSQ